LVVKEQVDTLKDEVVVVHSTVELLVVDVEEEVVLHDVDELLGVGVKEKVLAHTVLAKEVVAIEYTFEYPFALNWVVVVVARN
jgi:hypothetical protein